MRMNQNEVRIGQLTLLVSVMQTMQLMPAGQAAFPAAAVADDVIAGARYILPSS